MKNVAHTFPENVIIANVIELSSVVLEGLVIARYLTYLDTAYVIHKFLGITCGHQFASSCQAARLKY